jgi:prophage antirepressor-like protein
MNITTYNFGKQEIRIIDKDGEPWWIAKDVCEVLGISNISDACSTLDEDEKNTIALTDSINPGNPNILIINEPGLYALVLKSRKQDAKVFKRWITHDVLPSIRKTGVYGVNKEILDDPVIMLRMRQMETEARIKKIEDTINIDENYLAIHAYLKIHKVKHSDSDRKKLGWALKKFNARTGNPVKVPKSIYGTVKSYHVDDLKTVVEDYFEISIEE